MPWGRVDVSVAAVLDLPAVTIQAGLLARMLVVEGITPGLPQFVSQAEARQAMQWMRFVFANRLAFGVQHFGVSKPGATLTDLITAPDQVHGFQSYPTIAAGQQTLIDRVVKYANDGTHQKFSAYREYLQSALDVAGGTDLGTDPCPTGLYAWRTQGASSPGSNFVKYQTRGGQDFYTLTQEFKDDPSGTRRKK